MIRVLLYIVIAVLALSFFGISLQSLVTSPAAQANFSYLWQLVLLGWNYFVHLFQQSVQNFQGKIPPLPTPNFGG